MRRRETFICITEIVVYMDHIWPQPPLRPNAFGKDRRSPGTHLTSLPLAQREGSRPMTTHPVIECIGSHPVLNAGIRPASQFCTPVAAVARCRAAPSGCCCTRKCPDALENLGPIHRQPIFLNWVNGLRCLSHLDYTVCAASLREIRTMSNLPRPPAATR